MSNLILVQDLWKRSGTGFNDGNSAAGMEGTISKFNDRNIIYTTGSDHAVDWWINVKVIPTLKGLHLGFDSVVKKFLKSERSDNLKKTIIENNDLIFAAHSQGCGYTLSLLIRLYKHLKGKKIVVVFFGSPNLSFITKWALKKIEKIATVYSFKNDNDPVCSFPLWPWFGFKEIKLKDNKTNCIEDHLNYGKDVAYLKLKV